MDALNYHHLRYFWVVAHEGSIVAASRKLAVSHPTISAQLGLLEEALGARLFERRGRGLTLTETGRLALRYADEIFALGGELADTVRGRGPGWYLRLRVGVIDVVPKSIVHRLLKPAFQLEQPLRLAIREDRSLEGFLAEMLSHDLDLVLSDQPAGTGLTRKLFSHLLGASDTVFVAHVQLAERLREGFPRSLHDAPAILPSPASPLRRGLDAWFDRHDARPQVVAEVDDSALAKVMAEGGLGVCAVPRAVEAEVAARHHLVRVGSADVSHRVYAISADRKVTHPGVLAVRRAASEHVFRPD